MADRDSAAGRPSPIRLLLASSNAGKLREYRELAQDSPLGLDLLPNFRELAEFEESAPTFAENAVGKALHYSRFTDELVIAEDSGLVVPALGGAPGVHSARYAGPKGTDADCVQKLLREMEGKTGTERRARFVCVIAACARGTRARRRFRFRRGGYHHGAARAHGFGYDPVFLLPDIGRTSAEISQDEKNRLSHRGKAFRKIRDVLTNPF